LVTEVLASFESRSTAHPSGVRQVVVTLALQRARAMQAVAEMVLCGLSVASH
jgi:hypothetical protein